MAIGKAPLAHDVACLRRMHSGADHLEDVQYRGAMASSLSWIYIIIDGSMKAVNDLNPLPQSCTQAHTDVAILQVPPGLWSCLRGLARACV